MSSLKLVFIILISCSQLAHGMDSLCTCNLFAPSDSCSEGIEPRYIGADATCFDKSYCLIIMPTDPVFVPVTSTWTVSDLCSDPTIVEDCKCRCRSRCISTDFNGCSDAPNTCRFEKGAKFWGY